MQPTTFPPPDDPNATRLAAWVRQHQTGAWRYLCFLGGELGSLEDILQDALLAAVEKGIPEKPDAVAAAWLRGTIHNLFLMELRRRRTRPALAALTDEASVAAAFAHYTRVDDSGDATVLALRSCLELVAPRSRQAIDMFYGDGKRRDEIAEALGVGVEGVKTMLRRAKHELRVCVENKQETSS
ncbi:MAG: RNA polymerase sigma-70 factor (ECF subfamily) [Planctomycetota bacterium]|jgi:RNA polymerase sigma-70 factor (ECF subfamily)